MNKQLLYEGLPYNSVHTIKKLFDKVAELEKNNIELKKTVTELEKKLFDIDFVFVDEKKNDVM